MLPGSAELLAATCWSLSADTLLPLSPTLCRLVTLESATLTERQTQALFGDIKALQRNMQDAVGQDAGSMVRAGVSRWGGVWRPLNCQASLSGLAQRRCYAAAMQAALFSCGTLLP